MIDVKSFIYLKLSTSAALTALVPVDNISQVYPQEITATPAICFIEDNQPSAGFGDDKPHYVISTITVHVFTELEKSTTAICILLDQLLQGLLWNTDFSSDVPDPDVRFNHRVIKYRRVLSAEDLI